MKQIGKHLLKCISYIMSGVMLCTLFITYEAAAAKKPTLNKKKCGITIHETTKLTIKNGSKKAKVTWKSKKPKMKLKAHMMKSDIKKKPWTESPKTMDLRTQYLIMNMN